MKKNNDVERLEKAPVGDVVLNSRGRPQLEDGAGHLRVREGTRARFVLGGGPMVKSGPVSPAVREARAATKAIPGLQGERKAEPKKGAESVVKDRPPRRKREGSFGEAAARDARRVDGFLNRLFRGRRGEEGAVTTIRPEKRLPRKGTADVVADALGGTFGTLGEAEADLFGWLLRTKVGRAAKAMVFLTMISAMVFPGSAYALEGGFQGIADLAMSPGEVAQKTGQDLENANRARFVVSQVLRGAGRVTHLAGDLGIGAHEAAQWVIAQWQTADSGSGSRPPTESTAQKNSQGQCTEDRVTLPFSMTVGYQKGTPVAMTGVGTASEDCKDPGQIFPLLPTPTVTRVPGQFCVKSALVSVASIDGYGGSLAGARMVNRAAGMWQVVLPDGTIVQADRVHLQPGVDMSALRSNILRQQCDKP